MKLLLAVCFLFCAVATFAQVNCDTILPPPSTSDYVLPYPVGRTYTLIQGNCPSVGGHANTFAYDFNTQMGDTIVASRAGQVIFINEQYADSDWTSGHENNVFIRHNDGTVIRYTHLQQNGALVVTNTIVAQGQAIGLSGSSGNTGGVQHLHLQLFRDGTSYNKDNALPLNFSNTADPVDAQNLLINGEDYTALEGTPVALINLRQDTPEMTIFPNPFSEKTQIELQVKKAGLGRLEVINAQGEWVGHIFSGNLQKGRQLFLWEGNHLPPGLYFLWLQENGQISTKKVILK